MEIVGTPRTVVWSPETRTTDHDWQSTCLLCGESSGPCWARPYLRAWKHDHWTTKHSGNDERKA